MERFKISVSGGAFLVFSLLFFWDDSGIWAALIPAVIAHELGHALALVIFNSKLLGLHLNLTGFRMEYAQFPGILGEIAVLSAGPLSGIIYAFAAAMVGKNCGSEFLLCTAGISLALSLFNLLPAPMLDGGQILQSVFGTGFAQAAGYITGAGIAVAGTFAAWGGYGAAVLFAGCCILIGTCKYGKHSII